MTNNIKCWHFSKHPTGNIDDETMVLREAPLPELSPGQIQVRPVYISMDPTNRVWLSDWEDKYIDPVQLGDPMLGFSLGQIEKSRNDNYPKGSLVTGLGAWAERYVITPDEGWTLFPKLPDIDLAEAFGILAIAGPTAVYGLLDIGEPKAGETVLVTAAAGAVGSVAGQIAKALGCHVIGVAGGNEKCRSLTDYYGFDAAVDYKTGNLVDDLAKVAPEGVDVLFENVGGDILDAGLTHMNNNGRVVICGLISSYSRSGTDPAPGPTMIGNLIYRRLRMEGFVILDHMHRYPEFHEKLLRWMQEGKIRFNVHIEDGLDKAPSALGMLFTGENKGKLMVRISDPQ